jgi:hypothetical protein
MERGMEGQVVDHEVLAAGISTIFATPHGEESKQFL